MRTSDVLVPVPKELAAIGMPVARRLWPIRWSGTLVPIVAARKASKPLTPSSQRPSQPVVGGPGVLARPRIQIAIELKWLKSGLG